MWSLAIGNPSYLMLGGVSARRQSGICVAVTPIVTEGPLCGSPRSSFSRRTYLRVKPVAATTSADELGMGTRTLPVFASEANSAKNAALAAHGPRGGEPPYTLL